MTNSTLEAWRANPQTIDQIAGYSDRTFTYRDASEAVWVRGAAVSPALFPLLRATPLIGRVFTEDEDASVSRPVAVLSFARWMTRHDADPDILGRLITLDDVSYSVIGVMPEGFYFPNRRTELWIPLTLTIPQQRPGDRFIMAFSGLARLKDGVSLAQAEAEGETIVARGAPMAPGMGAPTLRLVGFHDEMTAARPQIVSSGYLEAMGLWLVEGRFITDQDTASSPRVFVVNEAFASAYFPAGEVVGQRLNMGRGEPRQVVGVVGNVHHRGLDSGLQPELCFPYRQSFLTMGPPRVSIVARTTGDPLALVQFLRQDILDLNPNLPIDNVMTMEDRLSASVAQPRFYALVFGVFAASALALAMAGVYGVLAYNVSRHGREIGLRMALGADDGHIRDLVIRQGALLVGLGVAVGLAGALVTTQALESLLFDVTTLDLPMLIVVPVSLVMVAIAACYLPARRATRVDPMAALRYE